MAAFGVHPYYQKSRPRWLKVGSAAGTVEKGAEDKDEVETADVLGPWATTNEHQEIHAAPSPLRTGGTSSNRAAMPSPVQPFDPTPYGQPYAGTSLNVAGFRTDGMISWQEWLR